MSETPEPDRGPVQAELPAPAPEPVAAPPPSPRPTPAPRSAVKALTMLGLVCLAVGFVWLAMRVDEMSARLSAPVAPGADPAQVAALEARLAVLERRPAPTPVDLRPLEARLAALERRPAGAPADLGPLEARLGALEQKPAVVAPADPRVDALAARLDRLITASAALAAEEAALRLDFPAAARQAVAASRQPTAGLPLGERILAEIARLVTVKDGERVLSGPPAAPALERAQQFVAVGDVAGAVKALDGLDPGAAQAMAPWRARAEKFLAARAALAKADR
jgi:hypothetical protein